MIAPVADVSWLVEHRHEVVTADVRFYLDGRSPREAHERGHLPGAVHVDLERWLAAPGSAAAGRHPLPEPAVFAEGMASLGIGDGDTVIAYDDAGGVIAARLVWMLRATGHQAAVLDGGLAAWPGSLATGPTPPRPAAGFKARPWPTALLADIDEAADARRGVVVIDARQRERFLGQPDGIDPRAGHIPGAQSLPCRENLDTAGRFLPVVELRERFAAVGVEPGVGVISYCGSGVTACHNLIALEHAGLGQGRLYPGSWSQYSNDATRPVATAAE